MRTRVETELYHLSDDPGELTNLEALPEQRERRDGLLALLMERVMVSTRPELRGDPARWVIAFAGRPGAAVQAQLESDGPLFLGRPWGDCRAPAARQLTSGSLQVSCVLGAGPGGWSWVRRERGALRLALTSDGQALGAERLFLGTEGLPSSTVSLVNGKLIVPTPSLPNSGAAPCVNARRDRGAFLFALPPLAASGYAAGSGLRSTFAAWGYAQ